VISRRTGVWAVAACVAALLGVAAVVVPAGAGTQVAKCDGKRVTVTVDQNGDPIGGGDERIDGTNGDDVINAGGGDDRVDSFGGDDLVCGGGGRDRIEGDFGKDTVIGNAGDDRGPEEGPRLIGGPGNDELYGSGGDDLLRGNSGNDEHYGERGDDEHDGGSGTDRCSGGKGNDIATSCERLSGI
jgi:Ca2+-binding RTX toxin-like protein